MEVRISWSLSRFQVDIPLHRVCQELYLVCMQDYCLREGDSTRIAPMYDPRRWYLLFALLAYNIRCDLVSERKVLASFSIADR